MKLSSRTVVIIGAPIVLLLVGWGLWDGFGLFESIGLAIVLIVLAGLRLLILAPRKRDDSER